MHWLILIPYYFFGALTVLAFLMLACRLLRLGVGMGTIAATAVGVVIASLVIVLAFDVVDIHDFTFLPMLGLFALSLLFAGVDAMLATSLPLPLDDELEQI
jgi:hypothetical protein